MNMKNSRHFGSIYPSRMVFESTQTCIMYHLRVRSFASFLCQLGICKSRSTFYCMENSIISNIIWKQVHWTVFRSNQLEGLRTSYLMAIDGPAFSWFGGWPSSTFASRALETITQCVILCRLTHAWLGSSPDIQFSNYRIARWIFCSVAKFTDPFAEQLCVFCVLINLKTKELLSSDYKPLQGLSDALACIGYTDPFKGKTGTWFYLDSYTQ